MDCVTEDEGSLRGWRQFSEVGDWSKCWGISETPGGGRASGAECASCTKVRDEMGGSNHFCGMKMENQRGPVRKPPDVLEARRAERFHSNPCSRGCATAGVQLP